MSAVKKIVVRRKVVKRTVIRREDGTRFVRKNTKTGTRRFAVPADEPRETDGGMRVVRYRKTTKFRNEAGNKVKRTIRRKRIEAK